MKVIQLDTNQHRLNEIISGKTNIFTREIRPETNSLFCDLDEDGYVIDVDGILQPRHYDALKAQCWAEFSLVRYRKSRDRTVFK